MPFDVARKKLDRPVGKRPGQVNNRIDAAERLLNRLSLFDPSLDRSSFSS